MWLFRKMHTYKVGKKGIEGEKEKILTLLPSFPLGCFFLSQDGILA
jgi:hypothetical protein